MPERSYHHGDLRRTVLDAAVELIAQRGAEALSLRELARRAGVSHAAPAHHFTDKTGLFTAIATQGHLMLAADFRAVAGEAGSSPGSTRAALAELGVRYVLFALDHPGHFEVMFRRDLCRADDPELRSARAATAELLRAAVPGGPEGPQADAYVLAAWSAAHGFAVLWRDGSLAAAQGDVGPEEAFRRAANTLFPLAGAPDH